VEAQTAHVHKVDVGWETGTDYVYLLRAPGGPASVLGMIGLHRRVGPRAIEIGYWTHVAHAGRGYMTAAVTAVTEAAAALDDVDRVEIHTDEANLRSAAIPRRLGYRLDRVDTRRPEALAESGRLQIWVRP
jgi:RimJ/RimL family protein N-acetyltransferase